MPGSLEKRRRSRTYREKINGVISGCSVRPSDVAVSQKRCMALPALT